MSPPHGVGGGKWPLPPINSALFWMCVFFNNAIIPFVKPDVCACICSIGQRWHDWICAVFRRAEKGWALLAPRRSAWWLPRSRVSSWPCCGVLALSFTQAKPLLWFVRGWFPPGHAGEHRTRGCVDLGVCAYCSCFLGTCAVPVGSVNALPHVCIMHKTHVILARSSHWYYMIKKWQNMVVSGSFGSSFVNILSHAGCCPCLRGVHTNCGGACLDVSEWVTYSYHATPTW